MSISIQGQTGWLSIPNGLGRSRLPYPTLALLLNLLTHSAGFNASYSTIKEQTGMASATIAKAVGNLEKLGLVTVKKVAADGGRFAANQYIFHADNLWKINADFVAERLSLPKPSSPNEAVTDSVNEDGGKSTASPNEAEPSSLNEAAPLQEMKTKNNQGERPENDQPPVVPQGGQSPKGKNSRGERLPENWMPDQRVIEVMARENPHVDLELEHAKFTDHFHASSQASARKRDWNAAWRNWIRRAAERAPRSRPQTNSLDAWGAPSTQQPAPGVMGELTW